MLRKWMGMVLPAFLIFFVNATAVFATEETKRVWQDESIYYLIVDRFYNGDLSNDFTVNTKDKLSYHGGDFQGVRQKLDYIQTMGFTTIRLGVIFDQRAYSRSGADTKDFYHPEEHYGTLNEFKQLVKEAHKREIKVMIDFPLTISPEHPWVKDPEKQNRFIIEDGNESNQENSQSVTSPKLNMNDPETAQYVSKVAKWWLQETKIDGYFFSQVDQIPEAFWSGLIKKIKSENKDLYIVGELSEKASVNLRDYKNFGFTSLLVPSTTLKLRESFKTPNHSLTKLVQDVGKIESSYLIKSTDGPSFSRFTNDIVAANQFPGDRWEPSLTYLFTTPGVPMIDYGSEIAITGDDPMMDFRADPDLIEFIEKLGRARNHYLSLTRGDFTLLYENEGMAVYTRSYKNETAFIALNNTSEKQEILIPTDKLGSKKQLIGLVNNDLIKEQNGNYPLSINGEESEIYIVRDDHGLKMLNVIVIIAIPIVFLILYFYIWKRGKNNG